MAQAEIKARRQTRRKKNADDTYQDGPLSVRAVRTTWTCWTAWTERPSGTTWTIRPTRTARTVRTTRRRWRRWDRVRVDRSAPTRVGVALFLRPVAHRSYPPFFSKISPAWFRPLGPRPA